MEIEKKISSHLSKKVYIYFYDLEKNINNLMTFLENKKKTAIPSVLVVVFFFYFYFF